MSSNPQTKEKVFSPLDGIMIRLKVKVLIQNDRTNKWLGLAFTNLCCYSNTSYLITSIQFNNVPDVWKMML